MYLYYLRKDFFYQIHIFMALNHFVFVSTSKLHARKSQNDAAINQIIFKTLTCGELPIELRHWKWIGRFLVQTLLSALLGLGTNFIARTLVRFLSKLQNKQWWTLRKWYCLLSNIPKLAMSSQKLYKKMMAYFSIFVRFHSFCLL